MCVATDNDSCDDCSSGSFDPTNDGVDFDNDGACDAGDTDDDNDGALTPTTATTTTLMCVATPTTTAVMIVQVVPSILPMTASTG